eukprot:UN01372
MSGYNLQSSAHKLAEPALALMIAMERFVRQLYVLTALRPYHLRENAVELWTTVRQTHAVVAQVNSAISTLGTLGIVKVAATIWIRVHVIMMDFHQEEQMIARPNVSKINQKPLSPQLKESASVLNPAGIVHGLGKIPTLIAMQFQLVKCVSLIE